MRCNLRPEQFLGTDCPTFKIYFNDSSQRCGNNVDKTTIHSLKKLPCGDIVYWRQLKKIQMVPFHSLLANSTEN